MPSSRSSNRRILSCLTILAATAAAALPAQQPAPPRHEPHLLRVWGYAGFSDQLLRWESAYTQLHPDIHFDNQLHAPSTVMAGLYNGVADLAFMGREIWPVETMAYHWVFQQNPFGVAVATAGLNGPGQAFSPVVIVNGKNPLTSISLAQLDAIYGSEHRAAPANIRTWGDLGATGAWAAQPIHPYGFSGEDPLGVFFRHDVLLMDFKPNPASQLFSDHDQAALPAAQRIAAAVAADPYAIGYTSAPLTTHAKILALEPDNVRPGDATLSSHSYQLTRSISIYVKRLPGQPLEPGVDAFIRFVLSPAGQTLVQPSAGLLPLTPALAAKQIKKLTDPMPKSAAAEDSQ